MYPLMADLRDKKVLVVGAGDVGTRKTQKLLSAGAQVTVVSPEASTEIIGLSNARKLAWIRRRFKIGDLRSKFLVIAATNSAQVNSRVYHACERKNLLVNSVDDPANCNFFVPATISRGKLILAISTSGKAPYFARRLKEFFDELLPADLDSQIEHLDSIRQAVLAEAPKAENTRSELVRKALDPEIKLILESFER